MKKLIDSNKGIRLIQAFGGIGTQAMALSRMNVPYEDYKMIEFDKYCIKSYNAIHGTNYETQDICDIHIDDLGIIDKAHYQYIMTYSFPCQDLSLAGKQAGMDEGSGTRSSLLFEVGRILQEGRDKAIWEGVETTLYLPDVLTLENVTQIHNKKNINNFNKWLNQLNDLGYITKWADMNAKDYGVPQNRQRCFAVSWLDHDADFEFPKPIELKYSMEDCLQPESEVPEKQYIQWERARKLIDQMIDKYGDELEELV